jgi:hypothetical protein
VDLPDSLPFLGRALVLVAMSGDQRLKMRLRMIPISMGSLPQCILHVRVIHVFALAVLASNSLLANMTGHDEWSTSFKKAKDMVANMTLEEKASI